MTGTGGSFARSVIAGILDVFSGRSAPRDRRQGPTAPKARAAQQDVRARGGEGRTGTIATIEITPPAPDGLRITYAPQRDGDPDAGEVVWTWVPYEENDGRGKDRPVLVIGRESAERVFAVRLTSTSHEGERDYLALRSGPWDSKGRPSWIDIGQVYSVHHDGMRREASELDRDRFLLVARALQRRYGWAVAV